MRLLLSLLLSLGCLAASAASGNIQKISSPDSRITLSVCTEGGLSYSLECDGISLIGSSSVGMTLSDGVSFGAPGVRPVKVRRSVIDRTDPVQFYKKSAIRDHCNVMTLSYRNFDVEFRVYDDAFAYRFISRVKGPFKVVSEDAQFNFAKPWPAYVGYVCQHDETLDGQFFNSFENFYAHHPLDRWDTTHLAFSPIMIEADGDLKIAISESDVLNYPGMFLYNGEGGNCLKGVFAPYPKETVPGGHRKLQDIVESREGYIAAYEGDTSFPWRIVAISRGEAGLLESDIVYRLATPAEGDFSWVKPGKVSWEWWNACGLKGVDFRTGVNNDTYKFYIDFASKYGIEYILLDEGWATDYKNDLFDVVPEIDLPGLCSYAEKKGVGIILWAGFRAFNRDMDAVCRHYSELGVKGWKVDFMDRDDQPMIQFTVKAAQTAAKYHQIVDFHGVGKPAGLTRTMPNVLNYEAVFGLENMLNYRPRKENHDQVAYDLTFPFMRLLAGPSDYTQGAMRNAAKGNFKFIRAEAMSQGTRCRQLAEYVIFDAPLTMLCDSPTNYMENDECTRLIASVPVVWDETRAIEAKVGEYIIEARRSGEDWWIAGMSDWTERDWTIDLSSFGAGPWKVVLFRDGVNADKLASDWSSSEFTVSGTSFDVHVAPGGGFIAKIIIEK